MIVYSCVARQDDALVLVESQSPELAGNAGEVARRLLTHLRDHPLQLGERKTWFTQNQEGRDIFDDMMAAFGYCALDSSDHYFHVYRRQYVNYVCLSDDAEVRDQNVNFDYLERLSREFDEKFSADKVKSVQKEGAFGKRFTKNIRTAAHFYNIHHDSFSRDKSVDRLMVRVESLKDLLGRHIALSLKHTEDLDRLVEKSDQMAADASVFKKRAHIMKNKMWRKLWMCRIMMGLGVVIVIYLFMALKCGFALNLCRAKNAGGGGGGDEQHDDKMRRSLLRGTTTTRATSPTWPFATTDSI